MHHITPSLQRATISAKALSPAACSDNHRPVQENGNEEFHALHMILAVVSDPDENRQLRMHWGTD